MFGGRLLVGRSGDRIYMYAAQVHDALEGPARFVVIDQGIGVANEAGVVSYQGGHSDAAGVDYQVTWLSVSQSCRRQATTVDDDLSSFSMPATISHQSHSEND